MAGAFFWEQVEHRKNSILDMWSGKLLPPAAAVINSKDHALVDGALAPVQLNFQHLKEHADRISWSANEQIHRTKIGQAALLSARPAPQHPPAPPDSGVLAAAPVLLMQREKLDNLDICVATARAWRRQFVSTLNAWANANLLLEGETRLPFFLSGVKIAQDVGGPGVATASLAHGERDVVIVTAAEEGGSAGVGVFDSADAQLARDRAGKYKNFSNELQGIPKLGVLLDRKLSALRREIDDLEQKQSVLSATLSDLNAKFQQHSTKLRQKEQQFLQIVPPSLGGAGATCGAPTFLERMQRRKITPSPETVKKLQEWRGTAIAPPESTGPLVARAPPWGKENAKLLRHRESLLRTFYTLHDVRRASSSSEHSLQPLTDNADFFKTILQTHVLSAPERLRVRNRLAKLGAELEKDRKTVHELGEIGRLGQRGLDPRTPVLVLCRDVREAKYVHARLQRELTEELQREHLVGRPSSNRVGGTGGAGTTHTFSPPTVNCGVSHLPRTSFPVHPDIVSLTVSLAVSLAYLMVYLMSDSVFCKLV